MYPNTERMLGKAAMYNDLEMYNHAYGLVEEITRRTPELPYFLYSTLQCEKDHF